MDNQQEDITIQQKATIDNIIEAISTLLVMLQQSPELGKYLHFISLDAVISVLVILRLTLSSLSKSQSTNP